MIRYRKAGLWFAETWFDETWFDETSFAENSFDETSTDSQQPPRAADILRCVQRSEPAAAGICEHFYTILIDLRQRPDQLLAEMHRETRYEIRRALDKDELTYQVWRPAGADCRKEFRSFYDRFAAAKGLARLNHPKIEKFAHAGALVLSAVRQRGVPLAWHAYYEGDGRARLLHSATSPLPLPASERSLLGRANRHLHWQDMSAFQTLGLDTYDFGGWYPGREDAKKIGINRFKEGFGGKMVVNYNCLRGLTRFGSAAVWFYGRRRATRGIRFQLVS